MNISTICPANNHPKTVTINFFSLKNYYYVYLQHGGTGDVPSLAQDFTLPEAGLVPPPEWLGLVSLKLGHLTIPFLISTHV